MKRTSLLAIAASASLFATGASAADLGGNCCADLEERIAELEATTVRKGNRKVSLTVSGHVNEDMVFWDDGRERNVYVGQTNLGAQTRFRFVGNAKITGEVTAGYLLEIGTASTRSDSVDQNTDDAGGGLAIRHSAWWIQHKDLGKLWLGQTSTATDGITEINLANTSHMGMQNLGGNVGGYFVRQSNGVLSNARIETFFGGANVISSPGIDPSQIGEGNRMNIIKYETPTYAGFIASAAFGEDDMWDAALRYAGEFSGFKLAFGVGYQQWTDGNNDERNCVAGQAGGGADRKCSQLGLSGAVMHVDSGVYLHGVYGIRWDELSRVPDKTSDRFYLQGGIEKNWFGIGKTTLFAEGAMYSITDTGATFGNPPSVTATGILASHTSMWGLGLNQSIDAAAMDLYVNYQHYDFDANVCTAAATAACAGLKDFQAVIAGGIIRF